MQAQSFGGEAPELAAELCRALNDWIREEWLDQEPRLLGSICPPHEHPDLAVREIERLAGDQRFVQVLLPGTRRAGARRSAATGRSCAPRPRPACPVALHTGGNEMHSGAGWPSYYLEDARLERQHDGDAGAVADLRRRRSRRSRACRWCSVEAGFAWAAALGGRWTTRGACSRERLTTGIAPPPSEHLREHFWFTTQPIEEPERPRAPRAGVRRARHGRPDHVLDRLPALGLRRPVQALPRSAAGRTRRKIFAGNACRLYGLPRGRWRAVATPHGRRVVDCDVHVAPRTARAAARAHGALLGRLRRQLRAASVADDERHLPAGRVPARRRGGRRIAGPATLDELRDGCSGVDRDGACSTA